MSDIIDFTEAKKTRAIAARLAAREQLVSKFEINIHASWPTTIIGWLWAVSLMICPIGAVALSISIANRLAAWRRAWKERR